MPAISVDIPDELIPKLDEFAKNQNMTREEYLLDIFIEHLSDKHLLKIAEERMAEHRATGSKTYSLEEVVRDLGLD